MVQVIFPPVVVQMCMYSKCDSWNKILSKITSNYTGNIFLRNLWFVIETWSFLNYYVNKKESIWVILIFSCFLYDYMNTYRLKLSYKLAWKNFYFYNCINLHSINKECCFGGHFCAIILSLHISHCPWWSRCGCCC